MDSGVTESDVRQQLTRMLQSPRFVKRSILAKLLKYLVIETLKSTEPEEWEIGVEVFDRSPDWNPDAADAIVRVNLIRLKDCLAEYYANEGYREPVEFQIVKHAALAKYRDLPQERGYLAGESDPCFAAARDGFFTGPGDSSLRCVVTGETDDVGWHHLDSDPFNMALVNLIPLCGRLRSYLGAVRRGLTKTTLPELDPAWLSEQLAPAHFSRCETARAYGCAALAFSLGEQPFGREKNDVRILRLADMVHYARHHFFEPLMHQLIRQVLLPSIARLDEIDPIPAFRLTIQLIALLEETGYYEDAQFGLTIANNLDINRDVSFEGELSLEPFKLFRRRAQLLAERAPEDERFDDLVRNAEDRAGENRERCFTLQVVRAQRWLRQGSYESAKRAYELLAPLLAVYAEPIVREGLVAKPPAISIADLSEIFLLQGIASCRVQPAGWQTHVEDAMAKGKRLMHLGAHILPTEYRTLLLQPANKNASKARRILQVLPLEIRPALRHDAKENVGVILKCLTKLRIPHKRGSRE